MTRNTKIKNYLEAHPGDIFEGRPKATIEDWKNQRHRMHVMQAQMTTFGKHTGSKSKKVLMYHIHKIDKNRKSLFDRLFNQK